MLTRSKLTGSRFQVPDVDLDAFTRSAGDLATRDLPGLIRKADVPRRFEAGVDIVADAMHAAAEQIPGRKPRSRWRPFAPAFVIVGVMALIGVTGWLVARSSATTTAREIDAELDEEATMRATTDGMANDGSDRPATPA